MSFSYLRCLPVIAWLSFMPAMATGEDKPPVAVLPSARELIAELAAYCEKEAKSEQGSDDDSLTSLARTQAYLGDFPGALRTIRKLSAFSKQIGLAVVCRDYWESTGKIPEIPADLLQPVADPNTTLKDWSETTLMGTKLELAKIHAQAGQIEQALKILNVPELNRYSAYNYVEFHLFLANESLKKGDKPGAHEEVILTLPAMEKYPKISLKRAVWLETAQCLALKLADPELVRDIADSAEKLMVETKPSEDSANDFLAIDRAKLGRLFFRAGRIELCQKAYQEALTLAESGDLPGRLPESSKPEYRAADYAKSLTKISGIQCSTGHLQEARANQNRVISRLANIEDAQNRDFHYSQVIEYLTEAGDAEGARLLLDKFTTGYYRMKGLLDCATLLIRQGSLEDARQLLDQAEQAALNPQVDEPGELWSEIAEVYALMNDLPQARKLFQKGIEFSRDDPEKIHHQRISFHQIRAGLLEDAYLTMREMQQDQFRSLVLAHLTLAVAQREAKQARMKNAP